MKKRTKWIIIGCLLILFIIFVLAFSYAIFYPYKFIPQGNNGEGRIKNIILIIVFILMPIAAGIFFWRSYRNTAQKPKTPEVPKIGKETIWYKITNWLKENWKTAGQLIIGVIGCHLLVRYFWPNLYQRLSNSEVFWLDHVVIALVYIVFRKNTGTTQKPKIEMTGFGSTILVILVIGNIFNVFDWLKGTGETPRNVASPTATVPSGPWVPVLLPQGQAIGKDLEKVKKFWKENLPTESEAEQMVIICRNESGGCNQFSSSGTVMMNTNDDGTHDMGAMQMNREQWEKEITQEKAKGNKEIEFYKLETLDGNLKAALHYYKKYGLKPWSGRSSGLRNLMTQITITAPTDDWSEAIPTPKGFRLFYEGDNSVVSLRLLPSNREYSDNNSSSLRFDRPEAIQFKSLVDKPVKVSITFK